MGAVTATNVYRESLGSLTLIAVDLTTASNSDTFAIQTNSPVFKFWAQSANGTGLQAPDVTWTASTGLFTITSGTGQFGALTLFILERT